MPQKAERGEFTDLEGLDLSTKLELLRKNEHWKCQVKKEVLEASSSCSLHRLLYIVHIMLLLRAPEL